MDTERINALIRDNRLEEAEAELAADYGADALYLWARLEWKRGRRTEAMSLYNRVIAEAPGSDAAARAEVALAQARDIMAFYNKDLYNP